jgi:hypothetical protein
MQVFESRQYLIFAVSEISKVDFIQVLETSADTVRKSVDGTKTFIKWDGETEPSFVDTMTTKEGPYTHSEMLTLLAAETWTDPNVQMPTPPQN